MPKTNVVQLYLRIGAGLALALTLLAPPASAGVREVVRGLDGDGWARVLDVERKRETPCEPAAPIPSLADLEDEVPAVMACPLDFAAAEPAPGMQTVMVFAVEHFEVGRVDYYLVAQELASARLAAFAILYRVDADGRHGIVAYGPTDGEVSVEAVMAGQTILRVVDPPGLDRYDPGDGPDVISRVAVEADRLRLLDRGNAKP